MPFQVVDSDSIPSQDGYQVLYFTASWCGPCKKISPIFEKYSNISEYQGVAFYKIDVDESPLLCKQFNIRSMPTFVLLQNSSVIKEFSGANEELLKDMLQNCSDLSSGEF